MENPLNWTEKQKQVAAQMGAIVLAMNGMCMKDLEQMAGEIDRDTAIGPLIDPTAWRDGKFDQASLTKKVVQAIIAFKKEVSGIGRFHNVQGVKGVKHEEKD